MFMIFLYLLTFCHVLRILDAIEFVVEFEMILFANLCYLIYLTLIGFKLLNEV